MRARAGLLQRDQNRYTGTRDKGRRSTRLRIECPAHDLAEIVEVIDIYDLKRCRTRKERVQIDHGAVEPKEPATVSGSITRRSNDEPVIVYAGSVAEVVAWQCAEIVKPLLLGPKEGVTRRVAWKIG